MPEAPYNQSVINRIDLEIDALSEAIASVEYLAINDDLYGTPFKGKQTLETLKGMRRRARALWNAEMSIDTA